MRNILLILSIVLLGSCSNTFYCSKCIPTAVTEKTDTSTTITDSSKAKDSTAVRDTSVTIPADSSTMVLDLAYLCDSLNRAHGFGFENNGNRSSAEVIGKKDKLYVKCKCEAEVIQLQIKEHYHSMVRYLKVDKRLVKESTAVITVKEKRNKTFWNWLGFPQTWACLGLFALWITIKILKLTGKWPFPISIKRSD